MQQDRIVVLDLGSEENPRLLRELEELGVACELMDRQVTLADILARPGVKGIILNGGPRGRMEEEEWSVELEIYNCQLPVLMVDHKGDDPWPEDEEIRRMVLGAFVGGLCGCLLS